MLRLVRMAAVIGALAYFSPEREPGTPAPMPVASSPPAAEALLKALPDGMRDRIAAEALRRSLEAAGRLPDRARAAP